ncbi:uncharacterized protein THITE_111291 [Thermothielavioides terrestris NRRL 8126]|uniref:Uncharacterized protein n=1 Tax=Thermothielavioides terrestris (strain ATCC 38088 / NRRL 8126) TaxID=578455 RepID=G2R0Z9_THETT|nr:uncharacterized protein THITE_111291 [Thermothielavioides terrestris NRRL 8126]AEO65693.1 hypothetical protein THITE_111291 [Thermothielavioides terrestris NRRL 8126]
MYRQYIAPSSYRPFGPRHRPSRRPRLVAVAPLALPYALYALYVYYYYYYYYYYQQRRYWRLAPFAPLASIALSHTSSKNVVGSLGTKSLAKKKKEELDYRIYRLATSKRI